MKFVVVDDEAIVAVGLVLSAKTMLLSTWMSGEALKQSSYPIGRLVIQLQASVEDTLATLFVNRYTSIAACLAHPRGPEIVVAGS